MQYGLMNKSWKLNISLIASLFGFGVCSAVARPALTMPPQVPDSLQVPTDQRIILEAVGRGTQIYVCQANADNSNTYQWTLKAPDAQLLSYQGQRLGQHYAGPTWEANDGSKVMGQVKAKVDSPQANAIPWLLVEARSHEGKGIFSQVNWVQRLHTVGGKAPESGCDQVHKNLEAPVSYTADYYFYSTRAAGSASN
jgi:hypothetical protein